MLNKEISKAISLFDDLTVLFRLYQNVNVKEDEVFQRLYKRYFDIEIKDNVLDICLFNILEKYKNTEIWFDIVSSLFEELGELGHYYSFTDMVKIATSMIYFSDTKYHHYMNESMLRNINVKVPKPDDLKEKINNVSLMFIEFHKAFLDMLDDEEFISFKNELEDETRMMISSSIAFDLFMKVNSEEKIKEVYERNKEER